jgi:protease PrsW
VAHPRPAHVDALADLPIDRSGGRPRLPAWLSVPVVVSAVVVVPLTGLAVATEPLVGVLALVPLLIVLPVLAWIDRLEPEPRPARFHALAWGATVAILVAVVANTITALTLGEAAAAVISAPLVEELMKGLAVVWAVRRREVDGVVDGIVYAGWAGAGFALVENVEYFLVASDDGVLAETFVARGLITPFAHPLFTMWFGLAVGLAVERGRRATSLAAWWWGWLVAAGLHAAWNGSLVWAEITGDAAVVAVAALAFVGVFVSAAVLVVVVRRRERQRYLVEVPELAWRFGMTTDEVAAFSSWPALLATRRRLARPQRGHFDDLHEALVRLSALQARPDGDDVLEQRLVAQVHQARGRLAA